MYQYDKLTKSTYPTPEELLKVIRKTEAITLDEYDDRPLIATAERAQIINARLAGLIRKRRTALNSFAWKIVDNNGQESKDKPLLEKYINIIFENFWELAAYGKLAFDLGWEVIEGTQLPTLFAKKDFYSYKIFQNLCYDAESNSQIAESDQLLLSWVSQPYMRQVVWTEIYRYDAVREAGNFVRKLKGILQVINKGGTPEEQATAELAAEQAVKNNYFSSSDMIELRLNAITGSGAGIFKELIEIYNNDLAITILGQANTPELPDYGGSRAALQVQNMTTADIIYTDMNMLENYVNKFLGYFDARNYGEGVHNNKFVLDWSEIFDVEKNAMAVGAKLDTGLPFLKSEIYAELGNTPPQTGDDIVQKTEQGF